MITVEVNDGVSHMAGVANGSVDLILTDPPYIISRDSGMEKFSCVVKDAESTGISVKTMAEWNEYHHKNEDKIMELIATEGAKIEILQRNYLSYGSIYGKKYAVKTKFGSWDEEFSLCELESIIGEYYKKLRVGGTIIIFFDIWKMGLLRKMLETAGGHTKSGKPRGFSKIRLIQWIKTNPQPINQRVTYLSNCKEYAIVAVKGSKATFNSKYDKGVYSYPFPCGKGRVHPTQKSLSLFEELIRKHSREGDLVMDTFLGGGTTAVACQRLGRRFTGCDVSHSDIEKVLGRLEAITSK